MDPSRTFNVLSLCSGIGGLELGLAGVVPGFRVVCHVEREAFAAAVLAQAMEGGRLDAAPIWADLATFDGKPWRGVVDCVVAGFPCQPWSSAGERLGVDDERWVWPRIADIVRDVGPAFVFLENVRGLLLGGLPVLLGDLADLGFDAEWTLLRASDVGAPHRRERVFILAHSNDGSLERAPHDDDRSHAPGDDADRRGAPLGDPEREGLEERGRDALTDAFPAPWPPSPDDLAGWEAWVGAGGPEPCVRGGPDGVPSRVDRVHALGNACVPACAALAWRLLMSRLRPSEASFAPTLRGQP